MNTKAGVDERGGTKGKPILNMEILVDKGKLDYIVLYEGDNMA